MPERLGGRVRQAGQAMEVKLTRMAGQMPSDASREHDDAVEMKVPTMMGEGRSSR